jgi:hypothetical protein
MKKNQKPNRPKKSDCLKEKKSNKKKSKHKQTNKLLNKKGVKRKNKLFIKKICC